MKNVKNIALGIVAAVLAAALLAGCQKKGRGGGPGEDSNIRTIKTYFLKGKDRTAVEQSFRLCGTENTRAIDNLNRIYSSNNLKNTVNQIAAELTAKYQGDLPEGFDQYVLPKINDLQNLLDDKTVTNNDVAYQYALMQHRIYLDNPSILPAGALQDLYAGVKAGQPDGCLRDHAGTAQTGPEKGNPPNKSNENTPDGPEGRGKKQGDYIFLLAALAAATLFYLEKKNRFRLVKRAGLMLMRLFGVLKTPPSDRPRPSYEERNSPQAMIKQKQGVPPEPPRRHPYAPPLLPEEQNLPEEEPVPEETETPRAETPRSTDDSFFDPSPEPENPAETTPEPPVTPRWADVPFETVVPKPEPEQPAEPAPAPPVAPLWADVPFEKVVPKPETPLAEDPVRPPANPPTRQPETTEIYARMPSGNLFFNLSPAPNYPDTPFVITPSGETGDFTLVTDTDTLERLFSMIDQLKDACELLNVNSPDPKGHFTAVSGKVARDGEYWRITEKIKLNW